MKRSVYILFLILTLLSSCTAPTPTPGILPTETSTQTPSPAPTLKPTKTEKPAATPIPGFEEWSVFNPGAVEIKTDGDALVMTLLRRALWFMSQRGVFLYKPVTGDFRITAQIYASKSSDPSQPPGGDGTVQLGGVMVRSGEGGRENYLFIVVGADADDISVETKNTLDAFSEWDGPAWDAPAAELRICRIGSSFQLLKRHVDTDEEWITASSVDRPDLPETLQVGLNIYSDSTPDLQVRYENVKIEPVESADDCNSD